MSHPCICNTSAHRIRDQPCPVHPAASPHQCECNQTCADFINHARHECCTVCHPDTCPSDSATVDHSVAHVEALVALTDAVEQLTAKLVELYTVEEEE